MEANNNACIESFHSVLKKERIYLHKYETREEAKKSIFEYIEVFYNNQRISFSLISAIPSSGEFTVKQLQLSFPVLVRNRIMRPSAADKLAADVTSNVRKASP
ncbi:IS3 family transposase [Paenibacillus sp. S3N08]|uniref:IS3 family transposase n=1 Tax=Paenibacillus agricola TaxID=2716264 RepID=A0ABX0J8H3_9BACL|nr:IS3 family transposase [Paenibacillus agricola]